jgi:SAM-dependent MidA family methyltransferase
MTLQRTANTLPQPTEQALIQSERLVELIKARIHQQGGWISFETFMDMALYTPHLGYYSGGAQKFGKAGDFVTAPEISPLFAQAMANQVAQVLALVNGDVLELGAGTGKLAAELLLALKAINQMPEHYFILEVSDDLKQLQHETLKRLLPEPVFKKVVWLNALPQTFIGVVIGNEVLDAIPPSLVFKKSGEIYERGIALNNMAEGQQRLDWQDKPLAEGLLKEKVLALNLPDDYLTEVNNLAIGLVNTLADALIAGTILLIDYGFGASEYYHVQRAQGTLMCHYQHYAHVNPLVNIGLQDITAHVDFTAVATAGFDRCLEVSYVNQASFLINCGLLEIVNKTPADDLAQYLPLTTAAQKLLSPAEMGELFKVLALSKGLGCDLLGFVTGDKRYTL